MTIHFWIFALAQLSLWETPNLGNCFKKIIPIQFLTTINHPQKNPPPQHFTPTACYMIYRTIKNILVKYPSSLSVCVSLDILTRPSSVSKQLKLQVLSKFQKLGIASNYINFPHSTPNKLNLRRLKIDKASDELLLQYLANLNVKRFF